MIRHIIIIFITVIISIESNGQGRVFDDVAERITFENRLDSLFIGNNYKQIIDLCHQPHPAYLQSACTYNLIGTYYFLGDSVESWKLLNKEITRIQSDPGVDAYSLENLLGKDYSSYKKFLINSSAKVYILRRIDSIYTTEPISDKENGIQLIHLLIEDQWVRNISSLYDHFIPKRRHLLPSQMDSLQAIQAQRSHATRVFDFYKAQNKVFSEAEVGRIYYWQLMLFFHEWDLTRRSFYHKLVTQGVKDGTLNIENQMNFEIGTEFIKMGVNDFFSHREEIQEEYRKKYSKPNFRIKLM